MVELRNLDFANVFSETVAETSAVTITDDVVADLANDYFAADMSVADKIEAWKNITRVLRADGHSTKQVASVLKRLGCRAKNGGADATDKLIAKVMATAKAEHRRSCAEQVCGVSFADAKSSALNALYAGKPEYKSGKKTINTAHELALPAYVAYVAEITEIDERGKTLRGRCSAIQKLSDERELTEDEVMAYNAAYDELTALSAMLTERKELWKTQFKDIADRIDTMHSNAFPVTRGRGAGMDLESVEFADDNLLALLTGE